jgi:hypothetical protein
MGWGDSGAGSGFRGGAVSEQRDLLIDNFGEDVEHEGEFEHPLPEFDGELHHLRFGIDFDAILVFGGVQWDDFDLLQLVDFE